MAFEVKAIILAGGLGTRLRPLTDTLPKCLVPIAGRPLLGYWVDALVRAGVREARVNNHAHADQVRAYVKSVSASGRLRLDESYEPKLLGSAGTIAANADLADGSDVVVIVYADNFSDVDLGRMIAFHRSHDDPFTMLLFRAPVPSACGIAELDAEGRVVSFVEKPKEPRGDLANGGVYVVDADAYREIAAMGAFDIGFEVLPRFVERMRGWLWEGYHLDVGTHEALEKARADAPGLASRTVERPGVFLDRDGTIIEHVHYIADPDRVKLLPGAASALRRLVDAGLALVVITNQSAIGRGMITVEQYEAVDAELRRQLLDEGVTLDGVYYCPEVPDVDDPTIVTHGDRKPGPGMLLRASLDLGLDISRSWMVGDMVSDALAGHNAGCRESFLVRTGKEIADEPPVDLFYSIVDDLSAAVDAILGSTDDPATLPRGEPS
jgi:histidinol-phosphate phosphatase family protein